MEGREVISYLSATRDRPLLVTRLPGDESVAVTQSREVAKKYVYPNLFNLRIDVMLGTTCSPLIESC